MMVFASSFFSCLFMFLFAFSCEISYFGYFFSIINNVVNIFFSGFKFISYQTVKKNVFKLVLKRIYSFWTCAKAVSGLHLLSVRQWPVFPCGRRWVCLESTERSQAENCGKSFLHSSHFELWTLKKLSTACTLCAWVPRSEEERLSSTGEKERKITTKKIFLRK